MAHPNDIRPNGTCCVCGDRLSRVIQKRTGKQRFRRHLSNPDCSTKGRGELIQRRARG